MTTPIRIKDSDSDLTAKVTEFGQLVVAPLDYSVPVEIELDTINTAFSFIPPVANKNIVITDIIAFASRNVSNTTPANVQVYEADGEESVTPILGVLSPQLLRGGSVAITGLNLIVPEGRWVNAITDDAEILLTIMYYRVPV